MKIWSLTLNFIFSAFLPQRFNSILSDISIKVTIHFSLSNFCWTLTLNKGLMIDTLAKQFVMVPISRSHISPIVEYVDGTSFY